MRSFTVAERRARLGRRLYLSRPAHSIGEAVGHGVGLHSTDPATPYLSLWARLSDFTTTDLDAALYEQRNVVKHLAMRRTLWIVRADDLPSVQRGASDRVADTERRKLLADAQQAGVTDDGETWLDAARTAVLRHLDKHGSSSAKELREALPELAGDYDPAPGKRWGGQTPLAPRILTVLGVQGDIVRGPNDGAWTVSRPRWASMGAWLAEPVGEVSAEQARADLVRRWLQTFGPATLADVKWWFGSTMTWAKQAVADVGAVEVDLHGTPGYALPDDLDDEAEDEPWCALLPGLDPATMGWYDRDWYLGPHRGQVFDRNGNAGPTAWCDGRIVGGWTQDAAGRVELRLLEDVGRSAQKRLRQQADALTEWLDGARISPRFPSPLVARAR